MNKNTKKPKTSQQQMICYCNGVNQETVAKAIASGCKTTARVADVCMAGIGACGGSCRPRIAQMIEASLNQTAQDVVLKTTLGRHGQ
jgi:NAD(P)H-nitrite reductase large subunit